MKKIPQTRRPRPGELSAEAERCQALARFENDKLLPWAGRLAVRMNTDVETILSAIHAASNRGLSERIRDPEIVKEYNITRLKHFGPGWTPLEAAYFIHNNFALTRAGRMLMELLFDE